MKVLMTGSHGFVGTNLIEALAGEFEIIRWDARVDRELPDVDAVIHLAGLAHDTKYVIAADNYFNVNTVLSKNIYDRFLESKAKKFIFFSSIKAQDNDTPYAQSKKKAEDYIIKNEDHRIDRNKDVYILRPCMMHGKGNKGNLNLLYKVVRLGLPWPLAAFENQRSFASMGNVSFIVNGLLRNDIDSGIYNICDDETVSTNELIRIICGCLGKKARLWRIPRGIMTGLAKIGDLCHLPINSERLDKLTENYIVDNSDIKRALGIDHMPVMAKDGLKATIKEMMKNE